MNYSYTNQEFDNNNKFSFKNFFQSNKNVVLASIAILIFVLLAFVIVKNYNDNNKVTNSKNGLSINILGSHTITINKNENFLDPGYVAIDKKEGDLTKEVQITGILDTSKPGTYTRYYTVINKEGTIVEITRTIIVKDEEAGEESSLSLNLKGNATISLKVNEKYVEPGYTASDTKDGDITKNVIVTGNVDTKKAGTYTLTYTIKNSEGKTKEVKRTIIVVKENNVETPSNVKATITVNTTAYTKDTVLLTINIQGNGYKYTILPSGYKNYNTTISYTVSSNGTYNFYVYDNDGNVQILTKTVSNIDKAAPTGNCNGYIQGSKTILNVSAKDDQSGISHYIYISGNVSEKITSNSYTLNFATKNATVSIYDKLGNYNTITCTITGEISNNPGSNTGGNNNDNPSNNPPASTGLLEVHFVNVGREDGIIIRSTNKVMVIDGGTYDSGTKMVNYLKALGVTKVDYLIGSHLHYNHIQAHAKIINNFAIGTVYYPQNLFTCKPNYCESVDQKYTVDALKEKNITPTIMKNGDQLTIDTNLTLKCIGPKSFRTFSETSYPQNYNSLNFIITYGTTKFMFTGDGIQQSNVLNQYDKNLLDIDVLKHPHHGNHSLTSEFVKTTSPIYDIITSSSDELGSKQGTTKKYLQNQGTKLYYSYSSGNILITSDGTNLKIKTNVNASDYKR